MPYFAGQSHPPWAVSSRRGLLFSAGDKKGGMEEADPICVTGINVFPTLAEDKKTIETILSGTNAAGFPPFFGGKPERDGKPAANQKTPLRATFPEGCTEAAST